MKPAIVFVITFVVAAAASTGAKVMTTKPSHAAADSTHADSTAKHDSTSTDTAAVASGEHGTPPVDTTPRAPATPVDSSKHVVADAKHGAPEAKPAAGHDPKPAAPRDTKPAPAVASAPRPNADTASERRLSKVFTSMEAKQAAKVLEHMADMDVHIILGYVGPRQAASIMAELPPERVAKLSKIAMNGGAR
jgi:hypothetical protein